MQMTATSRVTRQNQVSVPAAVRRRFGIHPGSVLEWHDDDGELHIRTRTHTLDELRAELTRMARSRRHTLREFDAAKTEVVRERHRHARR